MLNTIKGALNRVARSSCSKTGISAVSSSLKRADSRAVFHSSRLLTENVGTDVWGHNIAAVRCTVIPFNSRFLSTDAKADGDSTKQNGQDSKNAADNGEAAGNSAGAEKGEIDYAAKIAELEAQLKTKTELATKLSEENKELKNR